MLRDLTKGNPFKTLLIFYLPILLGNVFQKFYGMADTYIVGQTVSPDALTGVGSTGSVTFLIMGLALGLCAGFGVRTGQFKGAGDENMVRKSIAVSLELTLVFSVVLTAVTVPLTKSILVWTNTPEQYFDYAFCYLIVIFAGTGATMLYNVACGSLRAVGDSRAPLIFLIISAFINIGLDLLFIIVFGWTYYGAAIATVISSLLSGIASIIYMFKAHPQLVPKREHWKIDLEMMWNHTAIGLPMSLQYVIVAVGLVIQQSAVNSLNATTPGVATAVAVSVRVNDIFEMTFASMGVAIATFAAQNFGAKQYGKIRDGVTAGVVYMAICWIIGLTCLSLFGGELTKLFIDPTSGDALLYFDQMVAYSEKYLVIQAVCYPFVAIIYLYRNAIQGMGRSALTMWGGLLEFVGRTIASLGFVKIWGFTGTCLSHPTAWLLAAVFFLIAYAVIIKRYDTSDRQYSLKRIFAKKSA